MVQTPIVDTGYSTLFRSHHTSPHYGRWLRLRHG